MLTFLLIILILAALFLILVILGQNPKGGGVSATFGGSASSVIGARQTADFLEKATWYVAIGIFVVVILTNVFIPDSATQQGRESMMSEQIEDMASPIPQGAAEQQQTTNEIPEE
ncbi:MAG: preprotein translocase subunit SecG [Bacteroidetes bacterium]|nr:preprotein translocase subunit SecG [Bacteroidota bacterium]